MTKSQAVTIKRSTWISALLVGIVVALGSVTNARAELAPEVKSKVESYKKKLVEWAAHPTIVAAVKESNAKGGLAAGMSNAKWDDLADTDAVVKGFQTSAAGKLMSQWEADKTLDKLYVRDEKGNLVAGSNKPLLYNNANRPPFANPFKGQPWAAGEAKPDPTTQKKSVQLGVPILDGGKTIGVLQTAVLVD
jgi:hypothetical protein